MENFNQILSDYKKAQIELLKAVKDSGVQIPDIASYLNSPKSTVYSKINGNAALLHEDMLLLAKQFSFNSSAFNNYEEYMKNFTLFVENNKIFRQDYFLSIINKDNKGLKKRFQNPLLWQDVEVIAILKKLEEDLANSPFNELLKKKS